jgi:hypothetical protein
MRRKRIRVSDQEHARLKEYRDYEYAEDNPLGFIIGQLLEESSDR